jgi:prolyl-tRNA synthetase
VPDNYKFGTGALENDYHITGYTLSDIGTHEKADIRESSSGDLCAHCNNPIDINTAIEMGHIFKLGTKYSISLNAMFQDEEGKKLPIIMGSYGIGVGRILTGALETHSDEKGIVFPITIAPHEVIISIIGMDNPELVSAATKLYEDLKKSGVDTILDDRDATPGVKFSDADLLGIPIRVTVGAKGFKRGVFELMNRKTKTSKDAIIEEALSDVLSLRQNLYNELIPLTE